VTDQGTLHHYEAADGTELAYRRFGAGSGPPIVLCHGLIANGRQFLADAAWFAERGNGVLVPDLRGHGLSGAPGIEDRDGFSIPVMAADMIAMLDHAGADRVHWVGNSLGGIVALEMLGKSAARFASLAIFGTAFALDLPALSAPVLPMAYRLGGKTLVSRLGAYATTGNAAARTLLADMAADFDPRHGEAIVRHVRHYDLFANARDFTGPMLVLVCGRDHAVNLALKPALKKLAGKPNLTVRELKLAGHCANLDATEAFRAALEAFWDGIG